MSATTEHGGFCRIEQPGRYLTVDARWVVEYDSHTKTASWHGTIMAATDAYQLGEAWLTPQGASTAARILIHGAEVVDITSYGSPHPQYVLGPLMFQGLGEPPA